MEQDPLLSNQEKVNLFETVITQATPIQLVTQKQLALTCNDPTLHFIPFFVTYDVWVWRDIYPTKTEFTRTRRDF